MSNGSREGGNHMARVPLVADVRWEIYGDPDPKTGHFDVAVHWELA